MRNTILHEAEKFWLEAIYEAKSVKESTMVLDICDREYELAACDMRKLCIKIKQYSVKKPHIFQFDFSLRRKTKTRSKTKQCTV